MLSSLYLRGKAKHQDYGYTLRANLCMRSLVLFGKLKNTHHQNQCCCHHIAHLKRYIHLHMLECIPIKQGSMVDSSHCIGMIHGTLHKLINWTD